MYVGLGQEKLVCVHGDDGICHPVEQCGLLMCLQQSLYNNGTL